MTERHSDVMRAVGSVRISLIICYMFIMFALVFVASANIISFTPDTPADANWTNDATPDFIFTAVSDTNETLSCELFLDGVGYGTNESVSNATATNITANASLADAEYEWFINCTDDGGTTSNVTTNRTITIDTTNPDIILISPDNDTNSTETSMNFVFNVTDNLATILNCSLYFDSVINQTNGSVASGENTTISVSGLDDGNYQWTIVCLDNASNNDTSTTRVLNVDTTAPNITVNSSTLNSNSFINADVNITGYLCDEGVGVNNSGVVVYLNGELNASANSPSPCAQPWWYYWNISELNNGLYNLTFKACDYAGLCANASVENITIDTAPSAILNNSNNTMVSNADIFFSPADNIINFAINVSDNLGVMSVTVNLSAINQSGNNNFCNNNFTCNGTSNNVTLGYNSTSGLWEGACNISNCINTSNIFYPYMPGAIIITALDNASNSNSTGTGFIFQNMGVNNNTGDSCMQFGSSSTNFSSVTDFSRVNMVVHMQGNYSCLSQGRLNITSFNDVMLLNLSSVNMSTQEQASKLQLLSQALNVTISPPGTFGQSRIYINTTAFAELNTNATITFYNLPFAAEPAIAADNVSNLGGIVWASNGYNTDMGTITGNLTFNVTGFSGYNITDNTTPTAAINYPTSGLYTNDTTPQINITLNGTDTQISSAYFYVYNNTGGLEFSANYTNVSNSANCVNETAGSEIFLCVFNTSALIDGTKNITVLAYDYGGTAGNNMTNSTTFVIDTVASSITINTPANTSYNSSATVFNVTFGENASWCGYSLDSVANVSMDNTSRTAWNYTNASMSEGAHAVVFSCNDTVGNINTTSARYFVIDVTYPVYSANNTYPTSPANYSEGQTYQFNITWNDTNSINTSILVFNGTNYTMTHSGNVSYVTIGNISAGNYTYKYWANDSAGNQNETAELNYNLSPGVPSLILYINGSAANLSINYSEKVNVTSSGCPSELTCTLYRNDTSIASPDVTTALNASHNYTYVYNTTGNANYTSVATTAYTVIVGALSSTQNITSEGTVNITNDTSEMFISNASVSTIVANSSIANTTSLNISFAPVMNATNGTVTLGSNNLTMRRESTASNVTVELINGTMIIGGAGWDGKLVLPTVKTAADYTAPSSTTGTTAANLVIEVGGISSEVNLSQPAKITLPGMTGKSAAWSTGTTLTNISTVCSGADNYNNINSSDPRECYYDDSTDLIIWTYHFTKFAAYTYTAPTTTPTTTIPGTGCSAVWSCGEWSSCVDDKQTRTCNDTANCYGYKTETQSCTIATSTTTTPQVTPTPVTTPTTTPTVPTESSGIGTPAGQYSGAEGGETSLPMTAAIIIIIVLIIVLGLAYMLKSRKHGRNKLKR
ncbi:MAG: Ig-like domain-containing protein [Candidatus Aenigmatarchaeota archaeon]